MALHSLSHVSIEGVAACVPGEVFHISKYPYFTEQEKKDFVKYVGIKSKRYNGNISLTSDLCQVAADKLISALSWKREEIGLLILVTQTPDYMLPSTAIILQDKLKLSKNTLAFDVNLGCSGWVYGLSIIGSMMQALNINKAILLTGETAILADFKDKFNFPLMGDAGTATALSLSNDFVSPIFFNLESNGSGYEAIIAPQSGARFMSTKEGNDRLVSYNAKFNSQKVLEFCLMEVVPSIQSLLSFAKTGMEKIDYFIFHQANKIINESLRKRMGIPVEKLPYSIEQFANTSSASIPLTLVTQLKDDLRSKQLSILCSGFGVGLSLGCTLLQTNKLTCLNLIEV